MECLVVCFVIAEVHRMAFYKLFITGRCSTGTIHHATGCLQRYSMCACYILPLTFIPADHTRSGMLPGYVSGFYSHDDCHIDLARLAAFSKARLVHAGKDSRGMGNAFHCNMQNTTRGI